MLWGISTNIWRKFLWLGKLNQAQALVSRNSIKTSLTVWQPHAAYHTVWRSCPAYHTVWQPHAAYHTVWRPCPAYHTVWRPHAAYHTVWWSCAVYHIVWQPCPACHTVWQPCAAYHTVWRPCAAYHTVWWLCTTYHTQCGDCALPVTQCGDRALLVTQCGDHALPCLSHSVASMCCLSFYPPHLVEDLARDPRSINVCGTGESWKYSLYSVFPPFKNVICAYKIHVIPTPGTRKHTHLRTPKPRFLSHGIRVLRVCFLVCSFYLIWKVWALNR